MQNIQLTLGAGQHRQLPAATHLCILCDEGVLWVSCRGEAKDYFLHAGESLVLNDRQDVIVGPAPAATAATRVRVIYLAAGWSALLIRFCSRFAQCLWHKPVALAPAGNIRERERISC